jgi:hypothetical protein
MGIMPHVPSASGPLPEPTVLGVMPEPADPERIALYRQMLKGAENYVRAIDAHG